MLLYYIKQKQRYLLEKFDARATCSNTLINTLFCAQFEDFTKKSEVGEIWERDSRIVNFLMGELRYRKRCHDVNTIYLLLNQLNTHQFLAAIHLNEWRIEVYDSLYSPQQKEDRLRVVRRLASMLPHALEVVQFFEVRSKLAKYRWMELNITYNKKVCPQQSE